MSTIREDPDFLRPLHKWTRTGAVIAQLTELGRLPRAAVLRRARVTEPGHWLERETLIAVARAFLRAGDKEAADYTLECLAARLQGAIRGRVASWRTLAQTDREDAERAALAKLLENVCTLTPTEEMWECNFTVCFQNRMNSVLSRLTEKVLPMAWLTGVDDGGAAPDGLSNLPDGRAGDGFTEAETRDLIRTLCADNASAAQMLFLRMEGYTDEEIAPRLGVTTRTLRNWTDTLRKAYPRRTGGHDHA